MPAKDYIAATDASGVDYLRALGPWADLTQFAPPPPPPPPPAGEMYVGSSQTGYNYAPALKSFAIHRTYDNGPVPASYSTCAAQNDFVKSQHSSWSCYCNVANLRDGVFDSQILSLGKSIPSGNMPNGKPYRFYFTLDHEPDVKINQKTLDKTIFLPAQRHAFQVLATLGRTDIIPTLITTQQPFYTGSPYGPADFWDPAIHKVWGVDGYNKWTPTSGNQWTTMPDRFSAAIAYFKANKIAWGITETNAYEDDTGAHSKAKWLTDGVDYIAANGGVLFCYWDQKFQSEPAGDRHRMLDSSTATSNAFIALLNKYGKGGY